MLVVKVRSEWKMIKILRSDTPKIFKSSIPYKILNGFIP